MTTFRGARFGGHRSFSVGRPMTDEEIHRVAPSVFAAQPHESRSERFAYIPTLEVLAGLRREGFEVVAAIQGRSRIEGKAEFTKHMLRLHHPDYQTAQARSQALGGVAPQVVLINAHDGTSSYRLFSGVFRSICTNSMIVMEDGGQEMRVAHSGDVMGKVIEGSYTVIGESAKTIEAVEEWGGLQLTHDEQQAMAAAAHVLRFGDAEGNTKTPFTPDHLLTPHRRDDVGNTLWLTHNRLQENMIRGGARTMTRDANNQRRRATMRPVNNIDGDVKLNRALWMLSQKMAELKGAA